MNTFFKVVALASYLLVLLTASLWPTPVDGGGFVWLITSEILKFAQTVSWLNWIKYNQLEALANILLYLPLGVFLILFVKRLPLWLLLISPAFISALAESVQRFLLPARYSTIDDVINNSIGGALGVLIAAGILRWRKQRHLAD